MKYLIATIFAAVIVIATAATGTAGLYHTGGTLLCFDCHTMHFSMQHNFDGTSPVPTTPTPSLAGLGNWLGTAGPNKFLLKAPANDLCLACHNQQTFAPDVLEDNINAGSYLQGREAGALNHNGASPYESWKGHTLDSTTVPPGYDPTKVGLTATWYDNTAGLECVSCHIQHGSSTSYRNLGPRALGTAGQPSFVVGTNDPLKDVWIANVASTFVGGSGVAATFGPYYDRANVNFNRNDKTVGTTKTSNGIDTHCGACHGNFHGGPGDTEIGGAATALDGFIRHPTSQVTIGVAGGATTAGGQGYGGHSTLTRYTTATTKVKAYSNNTDYANASPGCITCHKGHGNQNPFSLVFLNRNASSVGEQGGYATGQTQDLQTGYRNLCGQCHGQGNS